LGLEKLVKKAVAMVQVRKGPSDVKVEWWCQEADRFDDCLDGGRESYCEQASQITDKIPATDTDLSLQ
jgi:hypothetical protein